MEMPQTMTTLLILLLLFGIRAMIYSFRVTLGSASFPFLINVETSRSCGFIIHHLSFLIPFNGLILHVFGVSVRAKTAGINVLSCLCSSLRNS